MQQCFITFCGIFGIRELPIRICVWIWFLFQVEVSFRLLALPSIHLTIQQFMILIYCALMCRLNDFPDSLSHWQMYQLQVWPQISFYKLLWNPQNRSCEFVQIKEFLEQEQHFSECEGHFSLSKCQNVLFSPSDRSDSLKHEKNWAELFV